MYASCGSLGQEWKWAAPNRAGPDSSLLLCLGQSQSLEVNLVRQAGPGLMKNMLFSAPVPKAAPIFLSAFIRAPNGISLILVFRFLEGHKEIWKEEPPCLATIDLFSFRLTDFYIKTKNKVILQGWPELITWESVPPCRTGEGLISIWAASLRPRKGQPYQ